MASPTPPHYITPSKPYQSPCPLPQPHHKASQRPHHSSPILNLTSSSSSTTTTKSCPQNGPTRLPSSSKNSLTSEFRRSRSTKTVSKRNPTPHSYSYPRPAASPAAARALTQLLSSDHHCFPLQFPLLIPDDYCSILHSLGEFGRSNSPLKTLLSFFQNSLPLMRDFKEKGKLLTAAISSLGRMGRPEIARQLFDSAVNDGFGNTVFAHSALVSAYARNGQANNAVSVFELMRSKGLKPNVVSYNAVIDACVKGNGDVDSAVGFFKEMLGDKVKPDSKTFNSLLAGCGRAGQLDYARILFDEMIRLGVGRDIYTYNTFIDAVSKCGNMELAVEIMEEMPTSSLRPNVVTFSTLIDGYSKLERFDEALELYKEMRLLGIKLDRVCYNTLLSIYVKTGKYEEIARVCGEMEVMGIDKDVVTYNSLISGYGKQGRLDIVSYLVKDMRERGVSPSVLTYSTLIDIYSKAGLYGDAANVFFEFKESGLKADVVLYSSFIDTLAKNGLVECAVWLLDEMVGVGIEPNVVTYNTVIDGFGKSKVILDKDGSRSLGLIVKGIGQPMVEESRRRSEELFCILGLFERMVQQGVKPNVVTFSAILNACSRCNSFKDASLLLEQLRMFDSFVYGVAHGLLVGSREAWMQARSLFDELKRMDPPTSSAFYNALTDMLWHFGQKRGAQQVVLEGVQRQVWENAWSEFCLDLHLMSSGAAQAMVHAWLLSVRAIVFEGRELPEFLSILTGWGKHSKVVGASTLRKVVEALLQSIGAPFQLERFNIGRFVSSGPVVATWLREANTISILLLHDERTQMVSTSPGSLLPQLQALQL